MSKLIARYNQGSFIYDGKLYHQLSVMEDGVASPSDLYIWFETKRVKRKDSACGHGYLRVQVIKREDVSASNPWSEVITPMLNYVSVTALNIKGMRVEESEYGWVGTDELTDAVTHVLEVSEVIDTKHLLTTFLKNRQYNLLYADIIEEDIPEYLIEQHRNTNDSYGAVSRGKED